MIHLMLQRQVFYPDSPMGVREGKSPPLASLLPQLKLVALKLLPKEGSGITSLAKEVASGPALEGLCQSLLERTETS